MRVKDPSAVSTMFNVNNSFIYGKECGDIVYDI